MSHTQSCPVLVYSVLFSFILFWKDKPHTRALFLLSWYSLISIGNLFSSSLSSLHPFHLDYPPAVHTLLSSHRSFSLYFLLTVHSLFTSSRRSFLLCFILTIHSLFAFFSPFILSLLSSHLQSSATVSSLSTSSPSLSTRPRQ